MAITITDQPYTWTPRGQKLMFICSSDNFEQPGFQLRVDVYESSTTKVYTFYLTVAPDNFFYFDLNPLVNLRNDETANIHKTFDAAHVEQMGNSWQSYGLDFREYWIVDGVLTENPESLVNTSLAVYNGYLQPKYGYKPDVFASANKAIKIANNSFSDYMQSDRVPSTHIWDKALTFNIPSSRIFIPAYDTDYGLLFVANSDEYCTPNEVTKYRIQLTDNALVVTTVFVIPFANAQIGIPCYPGNLINSTLVGMVDLQGPNGWAFYTVTALNNANGSESVTYVFYNAELYGQNDCRFDYVRLAWVNSRGGWDYFNFIKKNEITDNIERKQFKRVLYSPGGLVFNRYDRQLYDRQNIVRQVLTINSDWIQEGEFILLRSLMASNQVHLMDSSGEMTPVSLEDNSFVERKERNGKLYNVTLKVSYSQDYWS